VNEGKLRSTFAVISLSQKLRKVATAQRVLSLCAYKAECAKEIFDRRLMVDKGVKLSGRCLAADKEEAAFIRLIRMQAF